MHVPVTDEEVGVPVEDARTRRQALERPQVERLGEPGLGEGERDVVREAPGPRRRSCRCRSCWPTRSSRRRSAG